MESQIELSFEDIRGKQGAKLIRFIGDLDATTIDFVLKEIPGLFNEGINNIVADFQQLRYVNSTGLGILLYFSKTAKKNGGCFKIANINENVYEIIEIIGATTLLEIYDDLDEAIAALH